MQRTCWQCRLYFILIRQSKGEFLFAFYLIFEVVTLSFLQFKWRAFVSEFRHLRSMFYVDCIFASFSFAVDLGIR